MHRQRRKSTLVQSRVVENDLVSDDSDENSKKYRMNADAHEAFIKICVEKFDEINDTSTIRGTPTSSNVRGRQNKVAQAWNKIAESMNRNINVSTI